MKRANIIAIQVPEPVAGISEKGFRTFKEAEQQRNFVRSIDNTISKSLKASSGWSKKKIPDELQKTEFNYGGISGEISSKPTSSVSHKSIHDGFVSYLTEKNIDRRKFISIQDTVTRLDDLIGESTNSTLEQKIKIFNRDEFLEEEGILDWEVPPVTIFPLNETYETLNREAIVTQAKAKHIVNYITNQIIEPFNYELKSLAASSLGIDLENLRKTERTTIYQGKRAFNIQVIPKRNVSYAKAMREVRSDLDSLLGRDDELRAEYSVRRMRNGDQMSLKRIAKKVGDSIDLHSKNVNRLEWSYDPILEFAAIAPNNKDSP
jgi:hypothetical protein